MIDSDEASISELKVAEEVENFSELKYDAQTYVQCSWRVD